VPSPSPCLCSVFIAMNMNMMPSLIRALVILPLIPGPVLGVTQYSLEDIDSGKALAELSKIAYDNAMSRLEDSVSSNCTKENVKVLKEWYCTLVAI
jgi:hypothetical protein